MSGGGDGPTRVGELLEAFLEEKGVNRQVRRMEVLDRWSEVVGEAIAEVTRARSVSAATLFVEVRSSAWMMELDLMKERILARLNEGRDGEARIDKLVLVLGEDV